MREIKFRGWDGKELFPVLHNTWSLSSLSEDAKEEGVVLMQYTGFKDKNGKECFEGDILKGEKRTYEPIRFSNRDCSYKAGKYFCIPQWVGECEIIGNIHENPELLEVK